MHTNTHGWGLSDSRQGSTVRLNVTVHALGFTSNLQITGVTTLLMQRVIYSRAVKGRARRRHMIWSQEFSRRIGFGVQGGGLHVSDWPLSI